MDDEVARPNIKEELTTRDDYLDSRFRRLSSSGTLLLLSEVSIRNLNLSVFVTTLCRP